MSKYLNISCSSIKPSFVIGDILDIELKGSGIIDNLLEVRSLIFIFSVGLSNDTSIG